MPGCSGIDALAGDRLAGAAPVLVLVAALAVLSGVASRPSQLVVAAAATVILLAVADQVHEANRFSIASDGVFYAVVVFGPALAGWLIGTRNRQLVELRTLRQSLEVRREVLVRTAVAREHEDVARRVDHILAGRLQEVVADARSLASATAEDVATVLETIESAARGALGELRDVVGTLRDPDTFAVVEIDRRTGAAPRSPSRVVDGLLLLALVPLAIETTVQGNHAWWYLNVIAALGQAFALITIRRRPIVGSSLLVGLAIAQTAFLAPLPSTVSWFVPGLLAAFLVGFGEGWVTPVLGLGLLIAGVIAMTFVVASSSRSGDGLVPGLVMGALSWDSAGSRSQLTGVHVSCERSPMNSTVRPAGWPNSPRSSNGRSWPATCTMSEPTR